MSCKSLLLLGALLFGTLRVSAAAPFHAVPEAPTLAVATAAPVPAVAQAPTPAADVTCKAPPEPEAYTMTINNGPRAVHKVWVRENGSWRSYRVVPDCLRPCGTSTPRCAADAPCVRPHRSCLRPHCS